MSIKYKKRIVLLPLVLCAPWVQVKFNIDSSINWWCIDLPRGGLAVFEQEEEEEKHFEFLSA